MKYQNLGIRIHNFWQNIYINPIKLKMSKQSFNDKLVDLIIDINKKEIPENENFDKVIGTVKKSPDFNKQQNNY